MVATNLVGDVGSGIADVTIHLAHNTDMFITVQERVLLISRAGSATSMGSFVGLEAGVGEDDNHALGIFVG